jgi:hypothetical protein
MLICNEGNFPNIAVRPGFIYVAVWLFRPFRWHWKAHWLTENQKLSERIEELEEELQQLKVRYIEELDGDSFLRKWLTSERGVPFLATHDDRRTFSEPRNCLCGTETAIFAARST